MGAGEKLTLIWELTTTFVTFWNICGCFSCVALKRAVFCKCCYCCLMPVIFAWNSGCWSFSAKYLSDLCLDLSGKTCFNFGCWFPDKICWDLVANGKNVHINLGHILHSCKIMWMKIHDLAVGLNVWCKWHTCKTKKRSYFWKSANFATMEVTPQD